jgi:DNA-directed RNA polymerase subunit RPC12/RpoP
MRRLGFYVDAVNPDFIVSNEGGEILFSLLPDSNDFFGSSYCGYELSPFICKWKFKWNNSYDKYMNTKKFSCIECNARLPLRDLFTLKPYLVCRSCGCKLKVKKQMKLNLWCVALGVLPLNLTYNILFYLGYDYWSLIFGFLAGIISYVVACTIFYNKTRFEKHG